MIASKIDDVGGSFQRLVRKADEASNGDKDLKEKLLTEMIVREFVNKKVKKRAAAAEIPGVLDVSVPKRIRSGPCRSKPPQPQADLEDYQNKKKRRKTKAKAKAKVKVKAKAKEAAAAQVVVPEMPERFKNKIKEMGGSKVVLVIQKELKFSDLIQGNNRFSIPSQQMANNFLEPEEKERVVDRNEKMEKVKLIQPCLSEVTEVTLRMWEMRGNNILNLIAAWHGKVVSNPMNQLHIGSIVQLYAFRRLENNNELCFALVNLDMKNDIGA